MATYQTVGNVLSVFLNNQWTWQHDVMMHWNVAMGRLGEHVWCERIENRVVYASVSDYHLMHELFYMRNDLIKSIKKTCPQADIVDMRFRYVSERSTYSSEKLQVMQPPAAPVCTEPERKLSAQEQHALNQITDPDLQKSMKNFLMRCSSKDSAVIACSEKKASLGKGMSLRQKG